MIENAHSLARVDVDLPVIVGKNADLRTVHELETEDALRRLRRLEEWVDQERERQAGNRYQMALDEDFYDGLQWSDEDAQILIERGQAPLVYNKIAPTIRWITGTEKRTRIDWKVYPRSDDDAAGSEAKTKLLKYVQDVNKSAFARSAAFADAAKAGVGWLEAGIRADPTEFLIYDRHESWRNILYDSLGQDLMQQDWRYMIRAKQIDTDIAALLWPDRRTAIISASSYAEQIVDDKDDEWYLGSLLRNTAGDYMPGRWGLGAASADIYNRRSRVKVYEVWYPYPTRVWIARGDDQALNGKEFDPSWTRMVEALQSSAISLYDRVAMRMRCAVFIRGTFLADVRGPYRHNRFPFTPIWGYRRARDGMAYGVVRGLRDPQEDFNKRMSKALFAASARRIIADKGAVDDWEELRTEAARPDAQIVVNPGKKLEMVTDLNVAQHHIDYAMIDARMIQDASGVTDENMGRRTNATSGVAIEARQEQGAAVTADLFDNLRLAIQLHGEKVLSLAEQFITMPMQARIIGERQGYDFVPINWTKVGADGQPEIINDITAAQADFVVSQQDFRETVREAQFEELMKLVGKLAEVNPDLALRMLDDVLEMSNAPGKDDLVATVREITGKQPRDKRLTPEEKQALAERKAAEAAKQQAAEQMQMRAIVAEITEKEAKAKKLLAEAQQAEAEAAAAGDGGDAIRAEYDRQLQALRDDTAKLVAVLKQKVDEANRRAADRAAELAQQERLANAEITSKERMAGADRAAREQTEQARIAADERIQRDRAEKDKEAKIETARAASAAKAPVTQATAKAAELAQQFAAFRQEMQAALKEVKLDLREQLADAQATEREPAEPTTPQQPQPIVVVVPTEAEETEKVITIQSDAQGTPTGAVVRRVPKRKPKKESP